MTGIIGKKIGMTQLFREDGTVVPVTVIEALPGEVVQVKTRQSDGYETVKVGFFEQTKEKNMTRPAAGVFKKAGTKAYRKLKEFKMEGLAVGDKVTVEGFKEGDRVSVSATSIGKGFQGVMKRHNFAGGPASHGSMFKRAPGSIGQSSFPSKVWKNMGMPGRMGGKRVTTRNLLVAEVRAERGLIFVKGSVPGSNNTIVEIRKGD